VQRSARDRRLPKWDAGFLQSCARAFEIGCRKRDMIEASRFRQAFIAASHQMDDGPVAEPKPRPWEIERRTISIHKAKRVRVKRAGLRKIAAQDRHVIDSR